MTWGLANSQLGEREVTQALLEREHRLIHAGQVILGATLIRPDRKDEEPRFG